MTTVAFRRPTFSWKRAIRPLTDFVVNMVNAVVEARKLQAAFETASVLKNHNADFRNWSHHELVQAILSEDPVRLDKSPVKGRE